MNTRFLALGLGLLLATGASAEGMEERLRTQLRSTTQQLQALSDRGVRTARVLQERPEQRGQRLVLAAVDDTLRPRLDELRVGLNTRPLKACR